MVNGATAATLLSDSDLLYYKSSLHNNILAPLFKDMSSKMMCSVWVMGCALCTQYMRDGK